MPVGVLSAALGYPVLESEPTNTKSFAVVVDVAGSAVVVDVLNAGSAAFASNGAVVFAPVIPKAKITPLSTGKAPPPVQVAVIVPLKMEGE
jgi:hypothetical protein